MEYNTHVVSCGWSSTGLGVLDEALNILGFPGNVCHIGEQQNIPYNRFKESDNLYSGAKFVYTKRHTSGAWLNEEHGRTKVIGGDKAILDNRFYMYGSREVVPELYLPKYWGREVSLVDYFKEKYSDQWKDHLLVICFECNTSDKNWSLLCDFLGCDIPDEKFPR